MAWNFNLLVGASKDFKGFNFILEERKTISVWKIKPRGLTSEARFSSVYAETNGEEIDLERGKF
jgi:hypothetical protein